MANDLVARLGVDSTGWDAGFQKARGSMASFAGGISGMIAPLAGALAGVWGASESVGAFKESLEAQRKLSAVIEATGGAAGLSTEEIANFAAEMQTLTNFEDDATTASAAVLAAFTNIRGDQFTETIEQAMNLSTVMGGELQDNVKLLGKALNDPVNSFGKLAKAGVTFTDQQKQQIATMQQSGNLIGAQEALLAGLESKFGGAAQAVADPWKQLQNTMGDVAENIGSVLVPSINVLSEGMNNLLGPTAAAGDAFKSFGIEAATIISNTGGILDLAIQQWELFGVQVAMETAHLFTTTIPAYLNWFGENWFQILETVGSNTMSAFENIGTNIKSVWQSILNYFKTGKLEFNWKPLSDGFINTVKELPDIPPRVITDLEKGLESSIAAATESLGESMAAQQTKLTKAFDTNSKVPAGTIVDEADGTHASKQKEKDNKAALSGSAEAASVVLRGLGGKNNRLEDLAEASLTAEEKIAIATEKLAENSVVLVAGDF